MKNENIKTCVLSMNARSGQNHDNKVAPQVNFNPTKANIMDMLCIFVIIFVYFGPWPKNSEKNKFLTCKLAQRLKKIVLGTYEI